MVSHFTAKVSRGQIVISDVDLPDGTEVTVQIERAAPEWRYAAEVEADIRASRAEFRRGESISSEESLADLRRHQTVRGQAQLASAAVDPGGRRLVDRSPRKRTKPAARRAR
ncbi:MAG: hypothetical protein IPQ07_21075 [Myxococcales bacterium]|nr:hypothetical protein [Myxococcales bacterium]